jgi:hypothetical protein
MEVRIPITIVIRFYHLSGRSQAERSKKKPPTFELVRGFPFLGSLLFGTRSPYTIPTITTGAVVGDVEPGAFEDNGWRRKHAPYLATTLGALLQRGIAEMLAALKMYAAGQTFVFVHRHDDTSSSLIWAER